jgi:hypothetical protein
VGRPLPPSLTGTPDPGVAACAAGAFVRPNTTPAYGAAGVVERSGSEY